MKDSVRDAVARAIAAEDTGDADAKPTTRHISMATAILGAGCLANLAILSSEEKASRALYEIHQMYVEHLADGEGEYSSGEVCKMMADLAFEIIDGGPFSPADLANRSRHLSVVK